MRGDVWQNALAIYRASGDKEWLKKAKVVPITTSRASRIRPDRTSVTRVRAACFSGRFRSELDELSSFMKQPVRALP